MRALVRIDRRLQRLRVVGGAELLQQHQLLARLLRIAFLEPCLAEVLACRRVIGFDRQALVVGGERLVVVTELARRVADQVPRLVVFRIEIGRLLAPTQRLLEALLGVLALAVADILLGAADLFVRLGVELLRLAARARFLGRRGLGLRAANRAAN